MKISTYFASAALLLGALLVSKASANPVTDDLTSSDYITFNGLDWAWASPVDEDWFGNVLYAPDFHEGWRYATVEEWANRPEQSAFLNPDGSLIVASKYWNSMYTHGDYGDQLVRVPVLDSTPQDIWYVRGTPSSVPDSTSTLGLALLALGAVAALRRRS